ncbi:cation-translocating P-type ATPase [Candidatus Phytoplasma ziziphi]|uniref:cation-translocating P-type ATPase n=1 Tax=Ziziphus jujuba witches'-broom phytoplasma TaxID=135727 RepID=UPI001EDEC125|nr:cation-transporting P-type ATPase [Candidatus Phytoplasma ziziphi]
MDKLFIQSSLELLEKELKTNFKEGLTQKKVDQKILENGLNKLKESPKKGFWKKFFYQFDDYFVYILLTICLITFLIGIIENTKEELVESFLILIIILSNAFLGVFYEHSKENSLFLINKNTKPYAKILRDKELKLIFKEEIVVGDIIYLEMGDVVPADLRLIKTNDLKVNEAILTGETLPVIKNSCIISNKFILNNSPNLVFMDTNIVSGNAHGVVIETGVNTQIGKITQLISVQKKEKTPLEKNIQQLSKILSFIICIFVIINFILNLSKNFILQGQIDFSAIKKIILSSMILAVAVIPEGLLAIITIILASGIKKLIKKNAIVKNLKTLETLGAINIICTDKTGTLTRNKMTINKLYLNYEKIKINTSLISDLNITRLVTYGVLCNNNYFTSEKVNYSNKEIFVFDSVDQSFIDLGNLLKLNIQQLVREHQKIKEFPFDSTKKFMVTVHQKGNDKFLIIKGAVEVLFNLSHCIQYKNEIVVKNKKNIKKIKTDLDLMSSEGYKVLGIAYASMNSYDYDLSNSNLEKILNEIKYKIIFLGAFGIEDPIRSEILPTIQECQKAFIKIIMITGDHLKTAVKVASDLKIFDPLRDLAIDGESLELLKEEEFNIKLSSIKVYARTTPEQKLKIIQSWQKKGKIVGMIGDGVNDAPSIKKADIGISMGITGTDIAKNASDIILTNDNFDTIKNAIQEGRNIFDNIKKSVMFLLSCNIGEIILILLNTLLGHLFFDKNFIILNTLQILWINLVTDSLVAISLGLEHPETDIMQRKPRLIQNSLLNKKIIKKIFSEGIMISFLSFLAAFIGYQMHKNNQPSQYGQTYAFMVLSLSQLIHVFNFRSFNKSIFSLKPNFYLRICFIISFLLQMTILIIPFLRSNFQISSFLYYKDIIIIFLFSMMPLIIIELKKKIINKLK